MCQLLRIRGICTPRLRPVASSPVRDEMGLTWDGRGTSSKAPVRHKSWISFAMAASIGSRCSSGNLAKSVITCAHRCGRLLE